MDMEVKIISQEQFNKMQNRIHNQRKVINKQKSENDDLKASLAFTDAESDLAHHETVKLSDRLDRMVDDFNNSEDAQIKLQNKLADAIDNADKYKKRCEIFKKQNNQHLGKLIALRHVLNRDGDAVALR